jgi:benzoate-CoA ligase family protein
MGKDAPEEKLLESTILRFAEDQSSIRLDIPESFNVAYYFVDRKVEEGHGDAVAVLCGDLVLTYRQVAEQVNRVANAFAHAGIGRGDRVMLLVFDSPAFVAAFWGAIKLGAVPIPCNTSLTPEENMFMLRDSGAKGLVIEDQLVEAALPALAEQGVEQLERIWVTVGPSRARPDVRAPAYLSFEGEMAQSSPQAPLTPTHRDDPAFWLYTSGSTGRPKGAIHLQHDMVYCLELYAKRVLGISSADRTFSTSKLYFAYGLGNGLYFPAGVGGSTVLLPERPTTERVFATIRRYQPTLFFSVPTILQALLQSPGASAQDFRSVRCVVSAGEALPQTLCEHFQERFRIPVVDGIGSTEMLHMFISNRPHEVTPGSSGRPVPGYRAKIVGEEGREVAPGKLGNLWVSGESAAAGYWNRPEATRETFVGEWVATGDKYVQDENGAFWYRGRSDDMMKVSGLWVSPLEVESVLASHPAVLECAVVGIAGGDGLTKPKGFVVPKEAAASAALEAELIHFARGRLASYKVPQWIEFMERLPRTATGKLQRFKLRQKSST